MLDYLNDDKKTNLLILIEKCDYQELSKNSNLKEEFILKYPYQYWNIEYLIEKNKITDFKTLSKFKYIHENIINKYSNKPWDWEWLIENTEINVEKYIPFNLIEKYAYKWDYYTLSKNPNLIEEFILKYPYKEWDIIELIKNNKITNFNALSKFRIINQCIHEYPNKPWDWEWIIENTDIMLIKEYIPFNLIEKYENRQDYYHLSKNSNLTEEFILKYPDQNWDIEYLIENNKITNFNALSKFKYINYIIDKYPNKPWDWEWIIENNIITIKEYIQLNLIEKYPHKWNYYHLSKNPNLTEEFILKYPYKEWDIIELIQNNKITNFNALSKFRIIDQYIIDAYPNKSWDWEWLIENRDIEVEEYISFNLIEKYKNKWDYWKLSFNPNLTEEFISKYPHQNWNIEYLNKKNKNTDTEK